MAEAKENIVYVLINEAMPGYVKIGRTNDIERRLRPHRLPDGGTDALATSAKLSQLDVPSAADHFRVGPKVAQVSRVYV